MERHTAPVTLARRRRRRSLTEAPPAAPAAPDLAAPPFNVRAPTYLIASGHRRCWKCNGEIAIYALAVKPPFERRDGAGQWQPGTSLAVLSYVESLQKRIRDHLMLIAPRYFRDASLWHRRPYWMNHCEHCGAKIGDYETTESAVAPLNVGRLRPPNVELLQAPEPLEAMAALSPNAVATPIEQR
jgi:hypothetical protein